MDVDTVEECVASTSEGPLRVMPSLIPGAGLGLFTGEDVPAGTVLTGCTYGGDVLTFMQARAMRPETGTFEPRRGRRGSRTEGRRGERCGVGRTGTTMTWCRRSRPRRRWMRTPSGFEGR